MALLLLCTAGYSGTDCGSWRKRKFEQFIDGIFAAPDKTTGREQVDITGLMGQYAQGNEPSHHIAYLYNFVDKPEKTDAKIKYILDNFTKIHRTD
jgi:putative alpha-1,2-mannosidase